MQSATVTSLLRYPVKSMMGEELNACEVTEYGLLGDRAFGVIDRSTGKLANAKNPLKWPEMFKFRATFTEPPQVDSPIPPVRITLPNGTTVLSTEEQKNIILSDGFNRSVYLSNPSQTNIQFEGFVPEGIAELKNPGSIFTRTSPQETFFDLAMVHILTTSSINQLKTLIPESRIEARRFRPNIIIHVPNAEGFIENDWDGKILRIGEHVQLKISQKTKRCVMTTLAQGDLPNDPNVLKSLVKNNEANLGVYASVICGGTIKIDDPIEIV